MCIYIKFSPRHYIALTAIVKFRICRPKTARNEHVCAHRKSYRTSLFQHCLVLVQRFNAVLSHDSLPVIARTADHTCFCILLSFLNSLWIYLPRVKNNNNNNNHRPRISYTGCANKKQSPRKYSISSEL